MRHDLGLKGKRIIITGGASGIGFATAQFLADEGAVLTLMDRDVAALDVAARQISVAALHHGDITNEQDCDDMVAAAHSAMSGLDGVVHCAGVSDRVATAFDANLDDWQQVVDITMRGTFLVCRSAARTLVKQGKGSIVALSSVRALFGAPRRNAYGPAKAAVSMLVKNLTCEWFPAGVRINALAPGFTRTPMIDRLLADGKIDETPILEATPVGRFADPVEVAAAAAFLLSDWSSYISGVTLPVDGGLASYGGHGPVLTH